MQIKVSNYKKGEQFYYFSFSDTERLEMFNAMHIRSFFMPYDSGDANLGDSETINHVVKLLQRDVL